MKISILLPYKENFSPTYAGAVSLFIKDMVKLSKFKKDITVYGNTDLKNIFKLKYKNIELKKKYNAKVVGYIHDTERIPDIDLVVKDGEIWSKNNFKAKIIHIPGHTLGHICFHFFNEKNIFTGDTLFSLGCGKIFEGDHKQMLTSLNKIKKLPYIGNLGSPPSHLEYLEFVDANNLHPITVFKENDNNAVCIGAYVGGVRLIDNIIF